MGPVIDKVLGLRCTSLAISTARLWVLCQVSTSVAATVWRMWRAIKLNSLLVKVLMNTGQLAADCGNHRETLWTLLHPCKQLLVAVWLPAGSAWMAVRGNQRHRVWAEFHPYGKVGGQGDVDIKKTFRKKSERFFYVMYWLFIIKSLYKKHHLREQ